MAAIGIESYRINSLEILEITIKSKNLFDRALDSYTCFDRIFVPLR
jgi:hypothetical protein